MKTGTIIYIGGFKLPDKNAAAHRVLSNAKALRDLGYTVVFVDVDEALPQDTDILKTRQIVQGFTYFSRAYPTSQKQWLSYMTDIRLFEQVFAQYTDVKAVICYNYQAIALRRLLTFCHKCGVKVLADCTEWYSARGRSAAFFMLKGLDTWYRMRVVHKKLDGLITISSYLANYYKGCQNVVQLPPLVDLTEEKWRSRQPAVNAVLQLVYAGAPLGKDQIQYLVEALSRSSVPYYLDVIGITELEYLEQFPTHVSLLKAAGDNICFHGRLGHIETLSFVQAANYSCFFRDDTRVTRAGFPTKFVESISCGTPVLTNQNSDLVDYMETGAYGICLEALTPSAIEAGLSICFEQFGMRLTTESASRFDYRNYIENFRVFIEGVIR